MNVLTSLLPRLLPLSLSIAVLAAQEPAKEPPKPEPTPAPAPADKEPAPKVLQLGERVNGELTLKDIDGKEQRAHDLLGKVVVVNFYSIQCPVQAGWDERLASIQTDYQEKGVVFLHIDSNVTEIGKEAPAADGEKKSYENIREHLAEKKLPFRVFVDHGNKVADLFGATSTPHVYVFDTKGKLVYRGLVDDDQRGNNLEGRTNYLRDTIEKLLAGEAVTSFSTKEIGCSIKRVDGAGSKPRRPRGEGRGGERDGGK